MIQLYRAAMVGSLIGLDRASQVAHEVDAKMRNFAVRSEKEQVVSVLQNLPCTNLVPIRLPDSHEHSPYNPD